ncbi:HIT family protein [Paraburkholderia sp. RL18-103-BIB-C]|uniref:HIT family protein n=1 Tax=Paraburkholderia sp. RL18-103-BIB-C TaxID=3031637 RepID=UPI0038BDBB1C
MNDGSAAGQTVPHLHIHLIPASRATCQTREAACGGSSRKRPTIGGSASELDSTTAVSRGTTGLPRQASAALCRRRLHATYKFALRIALADLAVEVGADDGADPLQIFVNPREQRTKDLLRSSVLGEGQSGGALDQGASG